MKTYDVFLYDENGERHYYLCIYSQVSDNNNRLTSDAYGLFITTNSKYDILKTQKIDDYNVEIYLNNKKCFVCCDKWQRVKIDKVKIKRLKITNDKKREIMNKVNKFLSEIGRQINV